MLDTSLDIALEFLTAHPWAYLFPIARLEKTPPLISDNLAKASNNPVQIRAWHAKWRGCNWGLALRMSECIVMDVDRKPGKNGQETLDKLLLEYGDLPNTLTVSSPSGGLHYYFRGKHRFGLGKYGFGEDVDSPNYVLIPGCWLCSNSENGYAIINAAPVADAPEWFGDFLKEKAARETVDSEPAVELDTKENQEWAINYLRTTAPPCIQGQNGNRTLYMIGALLKDRALSFETACNLVDKYYNVEGKCDPLWSRGEGFADADRLDVVIGNAYRYSRENQPGSGTAEYAFTGDNDLTTDERAEFSAWQNKDHPFRVAQRKQADAWEPARQAAKAEAERLAAQAKAEKMLKTDDELQAEKQDDKDRASLRDFLADDDDPDDDPDDSGGGKRVDQDGSAEEQNAQTGAPPSPPDEPMTRAQVFKSWAWIVGMERFVRLSDGLQWSRPQFDSRYNHLVKQASVSGVIFKLGDTSDEERRKGVVKMRRLENICYRPNRPLIDGQLFNLWRPSPITPKEGDTTVWDTHLNWLFQNEDDCNRVRDWLAWVYQNQDKKPNHALLIVGENTGTGKSFIARVMEQLIGAANTQRPKNSSLKGDFNAWALRCKLCIIEELMQVGRREVANELRDIITEPTIEVNIKNVSAQLVENYMAMMAISNHPDAMPIDETDRRWLVVPTYVRRRDDAIYYENLFAILESPDALAAIAYQLQTRDLKGYNAALSAPDTEAKNVMIRLSRSDAENWLYENEGNGILGCNLVCIQDIVNEMPNLLQKHARLAVALIPTFLRKRLNGRPVGQVRLKDNRRVNLWAIGPRANMYQGVDTGKLSELYEAERKGNASRSAETVTEDFLEG